MERVIKVINSPGDTPWDRLNAVNGVTIIRTVSENPWVGPGPARALTAKSRYARACA